MDTVGRRPSVVFVVMRFFSTRVLRVFGVLTYLVAALIFGSHWIHALVIPIFPLILPGLFMFGDEWEPKFGVWGALAVGWLVSVPGTYLIAWLYSAFTFKLQDTGSRPSA